jgi:hypothetical protein
MSARFASKSLLGRLIGAITILVLLVTAVPTPAAYAASVHVASVSVSGPSGTVTYGTPGTVSFTVTVLCDGNGGGITVTPTVTTTLPTGVTWAYDPVTLTWGQNCGSAPNPQTTTLRLSTTSATPGGVTSFSASVGGVSGGGSLTVQGILLSVTGFAASNKVYDGGTIATPNLTGVTLSAGVIYPDEAYLVTSSVGASFSDKFVGNGKLVTAYGFALGGAQASNYRLTQPTTTANITKADLAVTIETADDKVYDGTTLATVTLNCNQVYGDSVTCTGNGSFDTKHAGPNKLVTIPSVSVTGPDAGNYNPVLTGATAYADIYTRPLTVTAVTDTKVYDGTTDSAAAPLITGTIQSGDTNGFYQAFADANAGTGIAITAAGVVNDGIGGANYDVGFVPASGTIEPRPITTVTCDNQTIGDGDPLPPLTFTYAAGDLAPLETPAVIDEPPHCIPPAISGPGEYPIVPTGGADPNYDFSATDYVSGTLTVLPVGPYPGELTLYSQGGRDGWVLESTETSSLGGTKNYKAKNFRLGDSELNQQYRSILSFRTSDLRDDATITGVTLKFKYAGKVGVDAFKRHGKLWVDIRTGTFKMPKLQLADFKAPAKPGMKGVMIVTNLPDSEGWYSATIPPAYLNLVNVAGITQFRLRFGQGDDNDFVADFLKFYSGNSLFKPELIIDYTTPVP